MNTNLPPCIVLGIDTQIGLNIIRELGRQHIPVIGVASNRNSIGLRSKYLSKDIVCATRDAQAIDMLRGLGEELGPCVLLAPSEFDIQWLREHQDSLGAVRPILPPADAFHTALDKEKTLELAKEQGIAVPASFCISSAEDIGGVLGQVRFPVIFKWPNPFAVIAALRAHGLALVKYEYANNSEEFKKIAERYTPIGQWPLIQQYCPGYGLGQFFFLHEGEVIRFFQHRRVREWPPEGGYSTACDAVPAELHVELQRKSLGLLRKIGWEGVAMVEYRYDPIQDQAVLMEINGRYWGSYPLAVHCHAGFALTAYCLHANVPLPALPKPLDSFRCRTIVVESKRLIRVIFQADKIQDKQFKRKPLVELCQFFGDFVRPHVGYYVWSWDDPAPFFADVLNGVWNLLKSMLRKR